MRDWLDYAGRCVCTPFRALRSIFPFTHDGRQTLIYLVFAGAGPALTLAMLAIMSVLANAGRWTAYERMAILIGLCLLIIVTGLAMFVSIRAVKLGKDGFEAGGWRGPSDQEPPL